MTSFSLTGISNAHLLKLQQRSDGAAIPPILLSTFKLLSFC